MFLYFFFFFKKTLDKTEDLVPWLEIKKMGIRTTGLDKNDIIYYAKHKSYTCISSDKIIPLVSWSEKVSEKVAHLIRILGVARADGTYS